MNPESVGLSDTEAQHARHLMSREPSPLEWGLYGALWSEHCSYKNSKAMLSWLPTDGPDVVSGPGGNAGVVRLDSGLEVAFKVESHNHPSYVEPVQGAATGVGGIIRDVVAMGARPVALMDSLRFGCDRHSPAIQNGVVAGVGGYGNAIGVPTVGGEVHYGPGYDKNPLVNVLCVGVRSPEGASGAGTARPGQAVYLIGQATGRDGIHGASLLASRDFSAGDEDMRPTVQVGDPYTGKLLMEATLAAIASGGVAAVQDLGAAGLASATSELAVQSGVGLALTLDRVPCREQNMTAYDIMLSETQERMLLVLHDDGAADALAAIRAWGLEPAHIGWVTDDGRYVLTHQDERVCDLDPRWLVSGCPVTAAPTSAIAPAPPTVTRTPTVDGDQLLAVLADPDCRDRRPIYQRYDSMIQTSTIWGPEHDLSVLRIRDSEVGLAMAVSGCGRWAAIDPYSGAMAQVALVVARLATQRAEPMGLTDGLNAGNPYKPEVRRAFAQMILGLRDAALAFEVPVTGGNVSFHNETDQRAIWPTPVIGALGRHSRPTRPYSDALPAVPAILLLINSPSDPSLGGSVFENQHHALTAFPRVRLDDLRRTLQWLNTRLGDDPAILSLRTIASGGLFATLVKMWMAAVDPLAVSVDGRAIGEMAGLLCEEPGQFVLAVGADDVPRLQSSLGADGIHYLVAGESKPGPSAIQVTGRGMNTPLTLARDAVVRAWRSCEGSPDVSRTS